MWRNFLLSFFVENEKNSGDILLILGVPTPKFRGTYLEGGGHQGVNKFFLHFWMIQTMFKNKLKKWEKEPKSEGPLPLNGKIPTFFLFFFEPFP